MGPQQTFPPHGQQGSQGVPGQPPFGGPGGPPPGAPGQQFPGAPPTGGQAPMGHQPPGPGLPPNGPVPIASPYPTGGQPGMSRTPGPEPVFPADAMGATESIQAVPPAPGRGDDRPLYRDEMPADSGADTAQFDVAAVSDYDSYDDYAGYDDYEDAPPRRGGNRTRLLVIAGFVVLLVVAGGGAFFLASGTGGTGGDSGSADAASVADEADDPGALTTDALFPETVEIEGQGTFTRVVDEDTEDCASGTHGSYGEALSGNDCRQLVRASYVSEDGNHAVTVGVAAMPTDTEAAAAMDAQDLVAAEWFAGLPGEEGTPAERLGYSGGHGSSGQWGRYVLFSLAANSDGTEEEAEGGSEDAALLRDIGEGFLDEAFARLTDDRA
ncbi:hypothetical protein ACFXKD_14065 [Nocardiopsis aegyptia]|uniref:hypothetical protein n=1 Tax=Nocardiopsis aegyptia TaxID=220378 RepID=UPI00366D6824